MATNSIQRHNHKDIAQHHCYWHCLFNYWSCS